MKCKLSYNFSEIDLNLIYVDDFIFEVNFVLIKNFRFSLLLGIVMYLEILNSFLGILVGLFFLIILVRILFFDFWR